MKTFNDILNHKNIDKVSSLSIDYDDGYWEAVLVYKESKVKSVSYRLNPHKKESFHLLLEDIIEILNQIS